MTQERTLGGKKLALPKQEPKRSAAQHIRTGRALFEDLAGHIGRGEPIPPLLKEAHEEFLNDSSLLMASPNPRLRAVFSQAARAMEEGLERAVSDFEFPPAMRGPPDEFGAGATTRAEPLAWPEPDEELEATDMTIGPEILRRASILEAPLEERDGRAIVTDAHGTSWDLTEALATMNQPVVREHLRQSMMGVIPGSPLAAHTVGAMPTMQLAIEGAAAVGLGENVRNAATAFGGLTLPWLVGFNPDGSMRGDEADLLEDPVWARAVLETVQGLDLDPSAAEALGHAFSAGIDFAAFARLGGALGKGAAGLAARTLPPGGLAIGATALARAGAAVPELAMPFNSIGKTMLGMGLYEGVTQATNPETSTAENLLHGVSQGAVFGVAGKAAKLLRSAGGRALGFKPGKGPGSQRDMEDVLAAVKGATGKLSKILTDIEMAPYTRAAVEHGIDAYLMGVLVHSYGKAQAAEEGQGFEAFWRGLFDPTSHATGLGFALNSALMHGAVARPAIRENLQRPEVQDYMRRVAQELSSPKAEEGLREAWELFDRMREEDPELFAGVAFVTPAEQAAAERAATPEKPSERPVDAARAYDAMRKDTAAPGAPKLLTAGEFHVEHLRTLGFRAKTDAGVYKHALNAVHEYLREIELNEESRYPRFAEVPDALVRRMLAWRDADKPDLPTWTATKLERAAQERFLRGQGQPGTATEPARPVAAPRGPDRPSPVGIPGWLRERMASEGVEPGRLLNDVDMARKGMVGVLSSDPLVRWLEQNDPELAAKAKAGNITAAEVQRSVEAMRRPEVMRAVEGEPAYQELAPLEQAVKVAEKTIRRRPSLGAALRAVAEGRKDAAWLRETFPEGAAAVGEGRPETWAGAFERSVRATWKDATVRRARERLREIEGRRDYTLRDFVRRRGGLRFVEDLANLAEEEGGRSRPLVHRRGSRRGSPMDELTEAAWEEGFFAERPDLREFQEALEQDIPHQGKAGRAAELAEREAGEIDLEQRAFWKERIESGAIEMIGRDALFSLYSGDARYTGMSPETLEKEILQLRAQAGAGDPGPVLAGPPETLLSRAKRAAAMTRRAVDDLKALDMLNPLAEPESPEALDAFNAVLRGARPENVPPADFENARAQVVEARDAMRDTLRESMRGPWEEEARGLLENLWSFVDARQEGRDVPAETRAALKEHLDEFGELKSSVLDRAQQEAAAHFWMVAKAPEGETFGSFLPPIAFGARKFTRVEDNRFGRLVSWEHWLSKPYVQEILSKGLPRKLFKAVTALLGRNPVIPLLNLGPVSKPQSERMRQKMQRFLHSLGVERGREEDALLAANIAGNMLVRPWRGARPPDSHHELLLRLWDSGALAKMKGPADLEKIKPGTGYLYEVYSRFRDGFEALGRELVSLGRITQEQFDKLGGGNYLSHFFIREQYESELQDVARGSVSVRYTGRSMAREDGIPSPDEAVMRVPDAVWSAQRGIFEEARTVRMFRSLRKVMEGEGEFSLTRAQLDKLGPFDRADHELVAVPIVRRAGESWEQATARYTATKRYPKRAVLMGARLAMDRELMAAEGLEKTPRGKRPFTREMADMYRFFLGESEKGPIYVPSSLAEELQIQLGDIFAPPALQSKGALFFDQLFAFKKRGLTILRPATWALMFGGNVERNHVLGAVPRMDAIRGMLGLPSFTRDGLHGGSTLMRWVAEDAPKERPASWSEADWIALKRAKKFLEFAGVSTSMVQTLGVEFASNFGHAIANPEVTRAAWERELDRQAQRFGWEPDVRDRMAAAIGSKTDQMFQRLEQWDAKILGWLGEGDPIGKARGLGSYTALWNLTDLFFFKYPAYLKASHENPDLPMSRLVHYALEKTTHALDTDPFYRRYASMHAPWGDALWRASEGRTKVGPLKVENAKVKLWASMLMRDRFWIDPVSMVPQIAKAAFTHPLRTGASLAIYGGLAAMLSSIWNDDEERLWQEEAAVAQRAITRWPAISEKHEEALARFGNRIGSFAGIDAQIPAGMRARMAKWWNKMRTTDPTAIPFPRRGGDTQTGSLLELTPAGTLINRLAAAKRLAAPERPEDFLVGVETLFGMRAQAAAGMVLGGLSPSSTVLEAMGGPQTMGAVIAKALADVAGTAGVLYPGLGLFTREGQYIGEAVVTNGQRWNEALRGISRFHDPMGAEEKLAGMAARLAWPSRSMYQKEPLRSPVDGWTAVLSEMYPGFNPSSADGRAKIAAHRWVAEQMSVLFGDLYAQHFDDAGEPGKSSYNLDERVRGALAETFMHTRESEITGQGYVEPNHAPEGTLLKAIAALPEEMRGAVIPHLKRWASRTRFKEEGMTILFEAGRRLEMPKELFAEAMTNALRDPDGTNLVKWWWSKAKDADYEELGKLAPLMWDVETPAAGEALSAYRQLMAKYLENRFNWPPVPEAAKGPEVPGAPEHARALQGGRALRTVIEQRSALDDLLIPR